MAFCLNNYFFGTFLSPRGQVLFSTVLNLMKEHSRPCCVLTTKIITTKWTDPTRVKLIQIHNPTKGQHHSSQSGRTQPGSNSYNSKKWTDPIRVKLIQVHKVDGSHQGSTPPFTKWTNPTRVKLISPQSGRIPPRVNTTVHKVDGPNQGKTYTSPKSGRTQQGSNLR